MTTSKRPILDRLKWSVFLVAILLVQVGYVTVRLARAPEADAFLIGDCPYYAATARSLLHDGDVDLLNQLAPGAVDLDDATEQLRDHPAFFALSPDGTVVPKHSIAMPLASVPFYAAFGLSGFLIFNVVQLTLLLVGMVLVLQASVGARWAALLSLLTTPFLIYTFNFSPDIFATALVVWSLVAARSERPLLAGLLAGIAVWSKIYFAVLVFPIFVGVVLIRWRAGLRFALGGAIPLFAFAWINATLYGAPWVTGYDREAWVMPEGSFRIADHYSMWGQPFLTGLGNLLFDRELGLGPTAPLWFLWPIGFAIAWRERGPERWLLVVLVILVVNVLLFAPFEGWAGTHFGNRYLFPALALGFVLLGPVVEAGCRHLRDRTTGRQPGTTPE